MTPSMVLQPHAPKTSAPDLAQAFAGKVLGDLAGLHGAVLAALGDRLGLWKDFASHGSQTSRDLASHTRIHPRYAEEWCRAMTASGYLAADGEHGQFRMPEPALPILAQEGGPFFLAGALSFISHQLAVLDRIEKAFRSGRGVSYAEYPAAMFDAYVRFTDSWFENFLVSQWIPAVPEVHAALQRGTRIADVGAGQGRALVKLAQAFPASTFVGFDISKRNVRQARKRARAAGVAKRVRFEVRDAAKGLAGPFELITTFDVVHDAAQPDALLASIRRSLAPGGTYLCLDINAPEPGPDAVGPVASFLYGQSLLHCLNLARSEGGEGLGTAGLTESTLRTMASQAGFRSVRKLPLPLPFNNLYVLKV